MSEKKLETFTCNDCGHQWQQYQNGIHNCKPNLVKHWMIYSVNWQQTDNGEFPTCEWDESVPVWVYHEGEIQHAHYRNPSLDNCWFELDNGEREFVNYWAEIKLPNKPNISE